MKKILIPVTNHATLGENNEANGTYAPEITHAIKVFMDNDVDYEIASINGGGAPIYGTDVDDAVNNEIIDNPEFQKQINNTLAVADVNPENYDAIFYPGGFGLLYDLAQNEVFAEIAAHHYEQGGVIGAVCHGPAGLLPITLSDGSKLLSKVTVTGFTREEEVDYGTIEKIPYLLEESLARTASEYRKVQPWQEFIVEDRKVITGQNPASAHGVAEAIVRQITV